MSSEGLGDVIGDETGESWNVVPSMDDQATIMSALATSLAQNNSSQPPSLPDGGAISPGQQLINGLFANNPTNSQNAKNNQNIVTRAIANQGQLLPIPQAQQSGGSNSTDEDVKKVLAALSAKDSSTATPAPAASSSSGGGGGILGDIGDAAALILSPFGTILCTELLRQGKLPLKWYVAGKTTFLAYPETGVQGYMLWAVPTLAYMRRYPDSAFSKFVTMMLLARAEYIAAREGVRGAKKYWSGFAANIALYAFCRTLGILVWIFKLKVQTINGVKT